MAKRWKRWLVVAFISLAVIAVIAVRWVWFPGRAFDPDVWKNEAQVREGVRLEMADRLIARGTLLGKTREEMIEQLGEPTPTGHFGNWDMVYWIGPERGFIRIDSEWLVLRLGEDGRVTENRIVRD